MLRTPDGHGRIELATFHTPKAISPGWPSSSAEGRPCCSKPNDQLSTRIWNG
jgi:hypothetical protein